MRLCLIQTVKLFLITGLIDIIKAGNVFKKFKSLRFFINSNIFLSLHLITCDVWCNFEVITFLSVTLRVTNTLFAVIFHVGFHLKHKFYVSHPHCHYFRCLYLISDVYIFLCRAIWKTESLRSNFLCFPLFSQMTNDSVRLHKMSQ